MQDEERWPNSLSLAFIEDLYTDYLRDPESVSPDWRCYFKTLSGGNGAAQPIARIARASNPPASSARRARAAPTAPTSARTRNWPPSSIGVDQLIRNYRVRGHIVARVDPLGMERPEPPELRPELYGFTEAILDRPFAGKSLNGQTLVTVRQIIQHMQNTYCRSIGVQFMHIDDLAVRNWLQERMEGSENRVDLSRDEQIRILTRLTDATIFEEFIQRKYIGAKTFSLEGAESLIPLLDLAIEKAGTQDIEEIVLGMAHRGRLNVLANILHKSPQVIFREFEDVEQNVNWGRGDVKYHLGYSGDWFTAEGRKIHLSLTFNPATWNLLIPSPWAAPAPSRTAPATRTDSAS